MSFNHDTINSIAAVGLAAWLLWLSYFIWRHESPCSPPDSKSIHNLQSRLEEYVALKAWEENRHNKCSEPDQNKQFEVLLGILKKTEAKSLGLSTVWSLAITSLVAASTIDVFRCYRITLMCLIIGSLPMAWLSLVLGMNHLDQIDFDTISAASPSNKHHHMREQLMRDLLRKERSLRLATNAAAGFVAIVMFLGTISLFALD